MGPEQDRKLMLDLEDHALRASQGGFDGIFLPDHHFNGYMPVASDSFIYAAYLSAKMPHMHFGFSVVSVPLHHPVRFTERVNVLDQITGGKLLVGVGSGTTPEEMIGFAVNYKDASPLAEKNLEIAEALWAKRMDDPAVVIDNGPYQGRVLQRITPAPHGEYHARLMPVALKETSARRAAVNAWPAFIPAFTPPQIFGNEPFKHVEKFFNVYKDMLLEEGHSADMVVKALDWTTHTYQCVHIAETEEQAREELEVILRGYQDAVERENEFNRKAEGDSANKKTDVNISALDEGWIGTWCLWGSPDSVIEHLRPYKELGIGNVLCGTTTGPLTDERLRLGNQTLDLLSSKVIPALKD
jgi:alkanesulfonate monooxygenase SsuD/methylene tetrahydromethanopterin reductase-like flavin-dependent oxidoreductase (luciferase family)